MTVWGTYSSERLAAHHVLDGFDSGTPEYDGFLLEHARRQDAEDVCRVYVVVPDEEPGRVVAYFTLSSTIIMRSHLPSPLKRSTHTPYKQLPATLLGRLARSRPHRGMLPLILGAAIDQALEGNELVASQFLVVEAADEELAERYLDLQLGFQRARVIDDDRATVLIFARMKDLRRLAGAAR